jgi:hypothetical protein
MADPIPLYRFLDSHGALKTLEAGRFRVGLVSNFNDPFEWRLGCTGTATPDQQKSVESFNSERQRWSETWMGVLCFSDSFSAPVLWSLYADKHSGVAFEVKYPWPDDHLVKMTYFPERPVMDFSRLREFGGDKEARNRYLLDLLARLMRNKSPGFIFEKEYRLQIDLRDSKRCRLSDGYYDWQLPDHSLKRVILGFCCTLDEATVRRLLDTNGFTETEVVRAKMCQETYSVIV